MARILVFGASITYGSWDFQGGWADRLKQYCHKRSVKDENFYCLCYNLGISGDNTRDLLKRFEAEAASRINEEEQNIIIFDIGANDSSLRDDKTPMVPEKEFESNLAKLFRLAKRHSNKIVYMGCTPADEEKTAPFWDNIFFRNSRIKLYDTIAKRVCENSGVHYIELFSKINGKFWDGLHPDTKQHQRIFERLRIFLLKNKWL